MVMIILYFILYALHVLAGAHQVKDKGACNSVNGEIQIRMASFNAHNITLLSMI